MSQGNQALSAALVRDAAAVYNDGDPDAVCRLLSTLAEFGPMSDTLGSTAGRLLCRLITSNRVDAVVAWLRTNNNTLLPNAYTWCPLTDALARASPFMLRAVLEHITTTDQALVNSTLEAACAAGCDENVRILIEVGRANPNTVCGAALRRAIDNDLVSTVRLLFELGAVLTPSAACANIRSVEMLRVVAPKANSDTLVACLFHSVCTSCDGEMMRAFLETPGVRESSVILVRAYLMARLNGNVDAAEELERAVASE